MGKEALVATAEIVVAEIAEFGADETVARAFAIAGKEKFALAATLGEFVALVVAKGFDGRAGHHVVEMVLVDIAKAKLGEGVVVADEHIAVPLNNGGMTAGLGQSAYRGRKPHPTRERGIEHLDEILPDIVLNPLIENCAKEMPPTVRVDRERSHAFLGALDRRSEVTSVNVVEETLDERRELDEAAAYLLEKMIEIEGNGNIVRPDHGQGVPLNPHPAENLDALHHLPPRRPAINGKSIFVVNRLRPVDRNTYKKLVVLEEMCPVIGDECPVGLEGIVDWMPVSMLLLILQRLAVERHWAQKWLASVPSEEHGRSGRLHLYVLLYVKFERGVVHYLLGLWAEHEAFLLVVAVSAGKVALRANGLGHRVEGLGVESIIHWEI